MTAFPNKGSRTLKTVVYAVHDSNEFRVNNIVTPWKKNNKKKGYLGVTYAIF